MSEANSLNKHTKGYAITISLNGKYGQSKYSDISVVKKMLVHRWDKVMDQVDPITSDYTFEIAEKSTKVHLHGIFSTAVKFFYKHLQHIGYQVYCRELRTPEEETNWFYYVNKDVSLFGDQQADTLPSVAEEDEESKDK